MVRVTLRRTRFDLVAAHLRSSAGPVHASHAGQTPDQRTCAAQNTMKHTNSGSEMPSTGSAALAMAPPVTAMSIW